MNIYVDKKTWLKTIITITTTIRFLYSYSDTPILNKLIKYEQDGPGSVLQLE